MSTYLDKRAIFPEYIKDTPSPDLFNVIVIPCYSEPDVISTLKSLMACRVPSHSVEVIVIINGSALDDELVIAQNILSQRSIEEFVKSHEDNSIRFHTIVNNDLPRKHAGVGLARKLGMDEAVRRFSKLSNPSMDSINGVITCLDADCTVNKNYLVAIEDYFIKNYECPGISIKYEHDVHGEHENLEEIIDYELHLRYYNQGLKYTGLPYSFQTVGSAMSVRSSEYQKQGGMNRRKAGEDFYFLHKFTSLEKFGHVRDAIVYPSARVSERVPFGTGRAMLNMKTESESFVTYKWIAFIEIKYLVDNIPEIYNNVSNLDDIVDGFPETIRTYLKEQGRFEKDWIQIKRNTKTLESFRKRFFVWLDAFWIMKFLNYHRQALGGGDVELESMKLLSLLENGMLEPKNKKELLCVFRTLERE